MEYNQPSQIVKNLNFGTDAKSKVINGVEKLAKAVKDIESATSPSANLVKTFEVTPPGAAAINITPKASSIGVFKMIINRYPMIGRTIN